MGPEVQLAFSCYPQKRNLGGVGVIKMARDRKSKEVRRVRIRQNDEVAFAGSLFHVNSVSSTCSFDPQPHICIPHEPTEVNFPDPEPEGEGEENKVPQDEGNSDNAGSVSDREETESTGGKSTASSRAPVSSSVLSLCFLIIMKSCCPQLCVRL